MASFNFISAYKKVTFERDVSINALMKNITAAESLRAGDDTFSRENHAKLAYDPKHVAFQLIPAESVNNIYLNDEAVYVPSKLKAYDIIELGNSKMIFVPFCSDSFRWSDVEK